MKIGQQDLLVDHAYRELQNAIFSHKLAPGTPLSVPQLARQLAISRSPVREAVQRLVHAGLAVSIPHRGAVVAHISIEELRQLYDVREVLEGLATRRATEHFGPSARDELKKLIGRHREALDEGKGLLAHIELDMQFHRTIRELARNEHLEELLETIQGQVRLAMSSLWHTNDAPRRALQDHVRILEAMSSGNPSAAESAARDHIARVRTALAESQDYGREEAP